MLKFLAITETESRIIPIAELTIAEKLTENQPRGKYLFTFCQNKSNLSRVLLFLIESTEMNLDWQGRPVQVKQWTRDLLNKLTKTV